MDLKNSKRLRNTFREDINNLVQRRHRETLSWTSKIAEGSPLSGDAALASARICLTHEEGLSLSDDAALALVRICLTPRSRRGNLEQRTKRMLKQEKSPHWTNEPILTRRATEESPHWAKEPILARRAAATWLAKRPVQRRDSKGKYLHKVDGLIEILYFFEENADEDPKIRVSVKEEG